MGLIRLFCFFCCLVSFIEEKSSFEYGQVNHALTAAMRTLMKEYLILITQLEHLQRQGLLSLQKLWFYIQPTMRTMELLASIGERFSSQAPGGDECCQPCVHMVFSQRPRWIKASVWVARL